MAAWSDRLKAGLKKTRAGWVDSIGRALTGRSRLDDELLEEIEELLIAGDVGAELAVKLVEELQETARGDSRTPLEILQELVLRRLDSDVPGIALRSDGSPTVILVTGVNGAGKTTTIAKLAERLGKENPDLSVAFAAADTFRAAAIEQLGIWAKRTGAHMIAHRHGADPSAVVFDAVDHAIKTGGVLFIDTAGRLQTKHNLMEELKKIERTIEKKLGRKADERLLVLDATTGQNGISQAERFHDAIDLTGIVLTKLDSSAKGGIVLAIAETLGIPLRYIGVGESAEDLHAFSAMEFAEALFTT